MPFEARTRITILLPAPTAFHHYLLVDQVLTDLIHLCGGVTHSADIPPTFRGRWFDTNAHTTKHDDLMLLFGDVRAPDSSRTLNCSSTGSSDDASAIFPRTLSG